MKRITVTIEYAKYDTFGRTDCTARIPVYEDEENGFDAEPERIINAIRKLFTNKNYINPCATFSYRDLNEHPRYAKDTGRVFGFGGDWLDKVFWDKHGEVTRKEQIKTVTKKHILDLYHDCVAHATGQITEE